MASKKNQSAAEAVLGVEDARKPMGSPRLPCWRRLWWTGAWMPVSLFGAALTLYLGLLNYFPGAAQGLFATFQGAAVLCLLLLGGVFLARLVFPRFGRRRAQAERADELFAEADVWLSTVGKRRGSPAAAKIESCRLHLLKALDHGDEEGMQKGQDQLAQALREAHTKPAAILGVAKHFVLVILLAFSCRLFILEPFTIPSDSMAPTLLLGDQVLIVKLAYGLRLPWPGSAPSLGLKAPEHGDVIVFDAPGAEDRTYVKRVLGLPGDVVELLGGKVHVNGTPVEQDALRTDFRYWQRSSSQAGNWFSKGPMVLMEERFGSRQWNVSDEQIVPAGRREGPFRVPEGEVFVLGDNRSNSSDSRFGLGAANGKVAYVPIARIKGKALIVWLSLGYEGWGSDVLRGFGFRWGRFFKPIR